jgi:integrase
MSDKPKGPIKLTDRGVAALKPGKSGRTEYFDTEVTGLFLRVSEKSKIWGWRYHSPLPGGGQPRVRLGRYVAPEDAKDIPGALTVVGARMRARRLRSMVDDGRDPAAEARAEADAHKAQPLRTVDDLAEAFFSACEKGRYRPRGKVKRAATVAGERWLYGKHIKPHLGTVVIDAVTRASIVRPLHALADDGKGVTANRSRALLHSLFAFAVKEDRIATNPVSNIDAPMKETPRERVATDAEVIALWKALKDPTEFRKPTPDGKGAPLQIGRPVRIALQLAMLTLQRRAEVSGMRVADLDLESGLWEIPGDLTKSGRPHVLPLAPLSVTLIREALALRPAPDDQGRVSPFVFPGRDAPLERPIAPAALSHAFRDLRAAIGVCDLTPHDLRRGGASMLADAGVSPGDVSILLNHQDGMSGARVTRAVYIKSMFLPEKRRALLTMERLLLTRVGERAADDVVVPMREAVA